MRVMTLTGLYQIFFTERIRLLKLRVIGMDMKIYDIKYYLSKLSYCLDMEQVCPNSFECGPD